MKLDFISGLLAKALRAPAATSPAATRCCSARSIAWRNLFWSLSNAMANNPSPWDGDARAAGPAGRPSAYRVFAPDAYPRIKDIVERTVTSALIYLPSSVQGFRQSGDRPLSARNMCAAPTASSTSERIKIMKLLWDAIGTEFGGRHELYERNYAGGWEDIRAQALTGAKRGGDMTAMEALVDQCMADYDENGWRDEHW